MVISPRGAIVAEGEKSDDIVIAEIDPFGGRQGGDSMNWQEDMRSRLFRERHPAAFGLLTQPHPPVLDKVPETIGVEEAVRISQGALTMGEERFADAEKLLRDGKAAEAIRAFERLIADYPHTWIDRVARERVAAIREDERE